MISTFMSSHYIGTLTVWASTCASKPSCNARTSACIADMQKIPRRLTFICSSERPLKYASKSIFKPFGWVHIQSKPQKFLQCIIIWDQVESTQRTTDYIPSCLMPSVSDNCASSLWLCIQLVVQRRLTWSPVHTHMTGGWSCWGWSLRLRTSQQQSLRMGTSQQWISLDGLSDSNRRDLQWWGYTSAWYVSVEE